MRPEKKQSAKWGHRYSRKATFDHQLSGSHRPAAFVSLCPRLNPAQGSVAPGAATCLCSLFPWVRTHCCVASLPVFVCVPVRTSCLLSVSKLALSLRQIRWVNNCPSLPVSGVLASLRADKFLHQMFPSIRLRVAVQASGESQAPAAARAWYRKSLLQW